MTQADPGFSLRRSNSMEDLPLLEPLWNALQEHHARITPSLAGQAAKRDLPEAWRRRRAKYESWLADQETFFVIAERKAIPVGYAFVTVGPGYASWATGDRLAELETLSVLPAHRGKGVGEALLDSVWSRLVDIDVRELVVTTAVTNLDSHRFYERHGFSKSFVVYYGSAH